MSTPSSEDVTPVLENMGARLESILKSRVSPETIFPFVISKLSPPRYAYSLISMLG